MHNIESFQMYHCELSCMYAPPARRYMDRLLSLDSLLSNMYHMKYCLIHPGFSDSFIRIYIMARIKRNRKTARNRKCKKTIRFRKTRRYRNTKYKLIGGIWNHIYTFQIDARQFVIVKRPELAHDVRCDDNRLIFGTRVAFFCSTGTSNKDALLKKGYNIYPNYASQATEPATDFVPPKEHIINTVGTYFPTTWFYGGRYKKMGDYTRRWDSRLCEFIPSGYLKRSSRYILSSYFYCYSDLLISAAIGGGLWETDMKDLRNFILTHIPKKDENNESDGCKLEFIDTTTDKIDIAKAITLTGINNDNLNEVLESLDCCRPNLEIIRNPTQS